MEYNTDRPQLIIREYGRNIQNLIDHACTIEDKETRQQVAEGIMNMMNNLNSNYRHLEELKAKLWHHIYIMSGEKLEVDYPYEFPEKIEFTKKDINYPKSSSRFRHYGKNVETMVKTAVEMEDELKQKEFVAIIGNYMKMVHRNWSGENISNEAIREDIIKLSDGKLEIGEDVYLDNLIKSTGGHSYSNKNKFQRNGKKNNHKRHNNKSRGKRRY